MIVIGAAACLALCRKLYIFGRKRRRPNAVAGLPAIVESSLEQLNATMLVFTVAVGSRLAGVSVAELRVPAGSTTAVIRRDNRLVSATDETLIRVGDQVLIAVPAGLEPATRHRVLAVSRSGRLAGWYGDQPTAAALIG